MDSKDGPLSIKLASDKRSRSNERDFSNSSNVRALKIYGSSICDPSHDRWDVDSQNPVTSQEQHLLGEDVIALSRQQRAGTQKR